MKPPADRAVRKPTLRVVIADEHVLTADSLYSIMSQARRDCQLLAHASSATEAVSLCAQLKPDLLLLDTHISGQSGIHVLLELKKVAPDTRTLLYCNTTNEHEILAAMRAGADGFLEKTCSRSDFLAAIDRVTRGENYLCAKSVNGLAKALRNSVLQPPARKADLTPREREIVAMISEGQSSKEIAKTLFLSVSTVETHRANIMTKVGARNVAQLIKYALQQGLVNQPAQSRI